MLSIVSSFNGNETAQDIRNLERRGAASGKSRNFFPIFYRIDTPIKKEMDNLLPGF